MSMERRVLPQQPWPNYECCEHTLDVELPSGRAIRLWVNARHKNWDQPEATREFLYEIRTDAEWWQRAGQVAVIDFMAAIAGVNACQVTDVVNGGKCGTMGYFVPFNEGEVQQVMVTSSLSVNPAELVRRALLVAAQAVPEDLGQ